METDVQAYLDFNFEKLRRLKASDKGEVWLATDRAEKFVVIKKIFFTGLPYAELKKIAHRLWPKIIYCAEYQNETVVVEEFIHGTPLSERLEEKNWLLESEAKDILLQMCDRLSAMHDKGIIHRDIKPANIILQDSGRVRLIDFDAARTVKHDKNEDTMLLGTKGYAPPEQFGYGQTDARSDIYSLGMTIKKLLAPNYDGFLLPILNKCCEVDAKNRWPSADKLRRAVSSRRRIRFAGAALAAVAATMILAYWPHGAENPTMPEQTPIDQKKIAVPETAANADPNDESTKPAPNATDEGTMVAAQSETPTTPAATAEKTTATPKKDEAPPAPAKSTAQAADHADTIEVRLFLNDEILNERAQRYGLQQWGTCLEIRDTTWQNWPQSGNTVTLPYDWSLRVRVKNRSAAAWKNPLLRVARDFYDGNDYSAPVSSLLPKDTLAPGEEAEFVVPIGGYEIQIPEDNYTAVNFELQLTGSGKQKIVGTDMSISMHLLPPPPKP